MVKIAIIGCGAMGMLFGGYLSRENDVLLIDKDELKVDTVNQKGICIQEPDGSNIVVNPKSAITADGFDKMDLVILFVKSMFSKDALKSNKALIGPDTFVMSLQNGAGHDDIIKEYVEQKNIIIGTTQHNSSIIQEGKIHHGGGGKTFIGSISEINPRMKVIEETFNKCGFETEITNNIQEKIWEKLFVNVSASALTAILQSNLGFLVDSNHAWGLTKQLIKEAVAVANGDGMTFNEEQIIESVHNLLENAKEGYTSIYADIRDGRKTEVDTISGAVVAASRRNNVPAPSHEFVVELIHALEDKK